MTVDRDQLLRQALIRIEELERAVLRQHEPIAVIGWGLRAPGAEGPGKLWDRLCAGVDSVGSLGDGRWPPIPEVVDSGGWVDHLREFDAEFFGISAPEAASVDPQQRLLLEVSWEALESAGIPGRQVPERTGVFVGVSNIDYREAMVLAGDPDRFFSAGSTPSTVSGRLAYQLGTRGPTLSVDTACSSSLVAVYLAVRHLRDRSCDVALAGGVNRIVTPHESLSLTRAAMLSPSGVCHPFSAEADGYVRGEGAGVVVLKRLGDLGPRDRVLGLVLGSAINQGGRSSGLTVPHGPSQQEVIRAALSDAGVAPEEVGYVEAHGTGTAVGDLIELETLSAVFAGRRTQLPIGSVKSSLGHLEAAAGVTGLVKALQVVRHATIPATLHHDPPHNGIDWVDGPIRVPTRAEPWGAPGRRVAGVSSFGFSGTNSHVVVAAPPDETPDATGPGPARPLILPISARHPRALDELAERWAAELLARPGEAISLAATAALGRTHFALRRCVVGDTPVALAEGLRDAAVLPLTSPRPRPRIAFLFTGQGAQVPGMAAELHRTVPVFQEAVEECLDAAGDAARTLRHVLLQHDERIHETQYTQPALFVMEYALARTWQSWGVKPDIVLGHSVGEYVATCVAGGLAPAAALGLLIARGRLMQGCPPGAMYAVGLGGADSAGLADRVSELPSSSVAAFNTPTNTVLSGLEEELAPLLRDLQARDVSLRRLKVSHAFHSPLLRPMAEEFAALCAAAPTSVPSIPVVSNLTGLARQEQVGADYWVRHALAPVQFQRGLEAVRSSGAGVLVEIGPAPVLLGMAAEVCPDLARVPSLARGRRDFTTLLQGLAAAYDAGVDPDWAAVLGEPAAPTTDAPTYPFQRREYWAAAQVVGVAGPAQPPSGGFDVLTSVQVPAPAPEVAPEVPRTVATGPSRAEVGAALRRTGVSVEVVEDDHVDGLGGLGQRDLWLGVADTDGSVAAAVAACAAVARTIQRLVGRAAAHPGPPAPRRLVVALLRPATRYPTPAERAVEALLRTAVAEHEHLRCALVSWEAGTHPDLGPDVTAAPTGWVSLVRLEPVGARRFTHILRTGPALAASGVARGAVLVTGGTGALGRHVVEALATAGHPRVVLLGRQAPAGWASSWLDRLRAEGADLRVVLGDVTDRADVSRALAACDGLSLVGVVHTAGVDHWSPLRTLDIAALELAAAAKARGAELLDEALEEHPSAALVAFSSLAAVLPTRGAAAYAAANAALEGVIARRSAAGRAGVAVAWGPWAGAGMAAGEEGLHSATGLRMLDPVAAAALTVAILHSAASLPPGLIVASADWEVVRSTAAPIGDVVLGRVAATGRKGPIESEALPPVRPRDLHELLDHVEQLVRSLLGSTSPVDLDAGFFDLGFDSLLVVELRGRLQRTLGVELSATVAFRYPTPRDLVDHLADEFGLGDAPARTGDGHTYPDVPAQVEHPRTALADVIAGIDARFQELDLP